MRTEKEIKEALIDVRHKIWRNDEDVYTWEKVKKYLDWVLSGEETKATN